MMFTQFYKWITRLLLVCIVILEITLRYNVCVSGHSLPVSIPWTSEDLVSKLDSVVESLQKCVQYPGLTVAVVKTEDSVKEPFILTRSYGVLDVESKRPVDDNTRFCIGSVTKGFTAALITQLLHDNVNFTLDTPVRDIFGFDFELCDKERTETASVRDLLAHKVGVAKHFGAFLMGYNLSRPDIVRKVRHLPHLHNFRSSRVFNNFMYVVAGQIAEKMNGTWWENQIVWRFLKKLNMDRTTFADRVPDWTNNFAIPHALENGRLVPLRAKVTGNILRPVGPAGSICTTATDMAKWMLMHLRNGTNQNGESILNQSVLEELFKLQNPFPNPIKSGSDTSSLDSVAKGYGLGWVIGSYRGYTRFLHSGFSNYYYSMVSLLPEQGIAIFMALNGPHLIKCDNGMKALHLYLTDLLLGENPWLELTNICSYPREFLYKNGSRKTQHSKPYTDNPMDITTEDDFIIPSTTVSYDDDVSDLISTTELFYTDTFSSESVVDTTTDSDETHIINMISDKAMITESSGLFAKQKPLSKNETKDLSNTNKLQNNDIAVTTFRSDLPPLRLGLRTRRPNGLKRRRINMTLPMTTASTRAYTETMNLQDSTMSLENLTVVIETTTPDAKTTLNNETNETSVSDVTEAVSTPVATKSLPLVSAFGLRRKVAIKRRRLTNRRRHKRNMKLIMFLEPFKGVYANPFFGDVVIDINVSVPALQFNYGYYGKALLKPVSDGNNPNIIEMYFLNSIWYQSGSDDMKLFSKLGMFNVQFGSSDKDGGLINKLVVFLFDTEKPPIFTRRI